MGERCNTDYAPTKEEVDAMAALVREGVAAGALGFSSSKTLLHKDIKGEYMPGTFSGYDEMLALGLGMKGLNNSVFELVSDHLGEDDEWAWVTEFQKQTGLTVTLIATTAPAYENGKMYRLAEQAREEGREIRPQAAGRPTGVLHGLQSSFHAFVGHPTWREELADLDHERAACPAAGSAGQSQTAVRRISDQVRSDAGSAESDEQGLPVGGKSELRTRL